MRAKRQLHALSFGLSCADAASKVLIRPSPECRSLIFCMENSESKLPFSPALEIDSDLPDYLPVSLWSVAALLIGVVSPVSLVAPTLVTVPLLAAAVSLVALWRLKNAAVPMLGRRAAVIGLALAILFGAAGPARHLARQLVLEARAKSITDAWFEHLREGRLHEAHQLMLSASLRMPLDESLEQLYANDPVTQEKFKKFTEKLPISKILAHPDGSDSRPYSGRAYAGR
jgi:hypothetical protein